MKKHGRIPPDPEALADAARLREVWAAWRATHPEATQEKVAGALGMTQGAFGHYLAGRNAMGPEAWLRLAAYFNVELERLSPRLARQWLPTLRALNSPAAAPYHLLPEEDELLQYFNRNGLDEERRRLARMALILLRMYVEQAVPDERLGAKWDARNNSSSPPR